MKSPNPPRQPSPTVRTAISQIALAIIALALTTSCAHPPAKRSNPRPLTTDQRQFNSQCQRWETPDQATGLEATRRLDQ